MSDEKDNIKNLTTNLETPCNTSGSNEISPDIGDLVEKEKILEIQNNLLFSVVQSHSISNTLNMCLDSALEISELECGGIYLFDKDGGIELVHAKGLSAPFFSTVRYYPSDSENVKLIKAGMPAYLDYTSLDLPFKKSDCDENLKAVAVIPIFYKKDIIGSLNIASRTINCISEPVKLSIEAIASVMGMLISRSQAEERLFESEERYEQAEKMARFGHWRRSFSNNYAFWSKGTHIIFGTDSESFIPTNESFLKLVHPSDIQLLTSSIEKALKDRTPLEVEYRVMKPDGDMITVHSYAEVKTDKNSQDILVGTIQDITHFKEVEQELKNQSSRLEEMNTAMKVLIEHRERELGQLEKTVLENINKLVIPYLEKAGKVLNKSDSNSLIDIALTNLETVAKPFAKRLSMEKLSPTELQVANLIKNGKTTKEIAGVMNISTNTVMTHRYNIRKKLGLLKEKSNMYTYLQSL
jgi:PAS domain S-box-containing protein